MKSNSRRWQDARIVGSSLAAATIEWYDFYIYGTATALLFPQIFFPSDAPAVITQLAAFSTFAVGFLARPLGGLLFGHFGDLLGRKRALVVALTMMGLSTSLIGCLPTYGQIGYAAPCLLVVLRFLQGVAVGGQWGGAALLAIENAPEKRRGFYGSFCQMGVPAGLILASVIFLIDAEALSPHDFKSWGWRVPFLLSVLLIGLGAYIQLHVGETGEFEALGHDVKRADKAPVVGVLRHHWREVLATAGCLLAPNGCFYVVVTYIVTYMTSQLGLDRKMVLAAVVISTFLTAAMVLVGGWCSDRFGRRSVVIFGAAITALWAIPFWTVIEGGDLLSLTVAMSISLCGCYLMYGPLAALFSELFNASVRYSGMSIGYNLGAILGGGFAPLIATALFEYYGSPLAVAFYMILLCLISAVSVVFLTNHHAAKSKSFEAFPQ